MVLNTIKGNISEKTSFIMTVFNESESISTFIESLLAQTFLPSEIIIVDGGSTDTTVDILLRYFKKICSAAKNNRPGFLKYETEGNKQDHLSQEILFESNIDGKIGIKIISAKGARIASGRNIAIRNSSNDLICVSDAGCILEKNWVFEITKYSAGAESIDVMGGYNYPFARKTIQALLAVCVLPKKSEIRTKRFMPSSRNISFSKKAWESVGGYPENMDYGEDMKFNFNIRAAGYDIRYNPDAAVYWNMRDNLGDIFSQFFRYSKGDAIGRIYTYRHLVRFFSLLSFFVILLVSLFYNPWFILLLALLFLLYCYRPYLRINYFLQNKKSCVFIKNHRDLVLARLKLVFLIPLLLVFIDTAKLSGYVFGLFKRRDFK